MHQMVNHQAIQVKISKNRRSTSSIASDQAYKTLTASKNLLKNVKN